MKARPAPLAGFTLVELLISIAILVSIVLILTSLITAVSKAWASGEQQVSEFQDGRAILELISRELSQAVISSSLQFVQNPSIANFPKNQNLRSGSDSIFWQAPASSTTSGNLAEIGYCLVEDHNNSGGDVYQLKRFYVPPTDTTNYQIFASPNQPTDTSAPWVTNYFTVVPPAPAPPLANPIASGVLAFWVRCFDCNGDLIPWLSGAPPMKFNSAAHFQLAAPGQSGSFKYINASLTARANLLPATVELTIVTLDAQSFRKGPSIPAQNAQGIPDDLPTISNLFSQALITNSIRNARTFSTRVNLVNSGQP
jgi:prepilin-type N-terminal cleavage/methylation domain-containing protein